MVIPVHFPFAICYCPPSKLRPILRVHPSQRVAEKDLRVYLVDAEEWGAGGGDLHFYRNLKFLGVSNHWRKREAFLLLNFYYMLSTCHVLFDPHNKSGR